MQNNWLRGENTITISETNNLSTIYHLRYSIRACFSFLKCEVRH